MSGRGLLAVALVVLVACGGDDGPAAGEADAEEHPLAGVTLQPEDVPADLEADPQETGPAPGIRALLPRRRQFPSLPPLPDGLAAGFGDGYRAGYAVSGQLGAVPPPPQEGQVTFATSTVARMDEPETAADLFDYLMSLHLGVEAPLPRDEVPAAGLGDERYGWHKGVDISGPEVRGTESFGYVWRRGEMVLTVTLGGAPGAVSSEAARDLAGAVDARAG
jgi:hypothetical protein